MSELDDDTKQFLREHAERVVANWRRFDEDRLEMKRKLAKIFAEMETRSPWPGVPLINGK